MAKSDVTPPRLALSPHPAYVQWQPLWQQLLDVYEGAGGFIDPTKPYLYAHPREWLDHSYRSTEGKWITNPTPSQASPKLVQRRKLARYENIAATLIEQLKSALFRKPPTRSFVDPEAVDDTHPLRQFWANADGLGRSLDAIMPEQWTSAAVFGHALLVADRAGETGDVATRADAPAVVLRAYTPLDMVDWLTDDLGGLTSVRLLEAVRRDSYDQPAGAISVQLRTLDADGWTVTPIEKLGAGKFRAAKGATEDMGAHGFGALPVVVLYARRRALAPTIGRSVLGDPALYIDLYNLTSEVRELLRNQTFALLNVPLGAEGSIERESALLGETAGTANVVFSSQPIDYVSPDGVNVEVYHAHIDRLVRLIYRLAVVGWDQDSRDAESAESRKAKQTDLHQMLSGYAAECEMAETALAKLVYRAQFGDQWEAAWQGNPPVISYPRDFDTTSLLEEIETTMQGISLELGATATKHLKMRTVSKLLPHLPQEAVADIEREIDAMPVKTQAEQERELIEARFGAPRDVESAPPDDTEAA